jgi:hypothetical protein
MLTFSELARKVGNGVHPGTVRRWVVNGLYGAKLPAHCVGARWYVAWDDYRAWQRRVAAVKRDGVRVPACDERTRAAVMEINRLRALRVDLAG